METPLRPRGYENSLVVLISLLVGVVMFDRMVITFLFPIIVPELNLQMWQAGALSSALAIAWAVSASVFGSVSDFKGRRVVLLPAVFLLSLLSWVSGAVASFAQMLVARAAMGAAEGPVYSVTMATVAEESTPSRRGFNMGAMSAMGPLLGFALGPIIAVGLAQAVGWRWTFFIAGLPGLVLGVILWKFLREPGSVMLRRQAEARGETQAFKVRYGDVLRYRNVWVASLFMILELNYLLVFATFGMLYLTNVHRLSMMDAGMAMAGLGVGSAVGLLVLPAISDYVGRRPVLIVSGLLAGLSMVWFVSAGANLGMLFFTLFVGGFWYGAINIGAGTIPAESVPFHFAATAVAIPVTVGEILGSTLMPTVAGALADRFGLTVPIYVAAAGAIGAAIVSLLFVETAPRVLARRQPTPAAAATGQD